jgi:hypothetical protein
MVALSAMCAWCIWRERALRLPPTRPVLVSVRLAPEGFNVEKAGLPLSTPNAVKQQTTSKAALKLRDDLVAAKNKLDEITATFK